MNIFKFFFNLIINFPNKFKQLGVDSFLKLKDVSPDVDSVVFGFTSMAAYRPMTPFDVGTSGNVTACLNLKLLQEIYGDTRKSKFLI